MLRSLACTSAALLLASCGSSSSSSPSAAPPPTPTLRGTIAGQSFVPADAAALVLGQATCSFSGVTATATGLALGFGSFTGLCSLLNQTQGCGTKANATIVNLVVVRANVAGGAPGPVQPGTYTLGGSTPAPDLSGNVTVPDAFISTTDATCVEASQPTATSGTIRIDAVGARITGFADVTFEGGSQVAGTFDVPVCGFQTDVCTALSGFACNSETCVP